MRLLVSGLLVAGSLAARAGVEQLNWFVDGAEVEFDYATIAIVDKDGKPYEYVYTWHEQATGDSDSFTDTARVLTLEPAEGFTGDFWEQLDSDDTKRSTVSTGIMSNIDHWKDTDDVKYYFQLELWNYGEETDTRVYQGMLVSYESLVHSRLDPDAEDHTPAIAWNAMGPAPIPEPTGGVMMLFGLAVLGLRRKARTAAKRSGEG